MNDDVVALAVSGGDLYAGGWFTIAGGSEANQIAKWNGSGWSALGSGMGPRPFSAVYSLAVWGADLYAGGGFTIAGGSPANYIARWNGSSWTPLGSGMNSWVLALAVSGGDLYAGGYFTTAGGKVSGSISRASLAEADEDNDGVPDSLDQCPGTPAGAIVNENGCSIDQLAPCEGPWKNHGEYVFSIAHLSEAFREQGLINEQQRDDIISAAARSNCGKTRTPRR